MTLSNGAEPASTEAALNRIEARNARVEADKAWETSLTRRAAIALGTYVIAGAYLTLLGIEGPWLHALVPPGAYLISTLSLPLIRHFWQRHIYKGTLP